ncbi:MAG: T9SS type A sorting domain-containing protein, partial [Bacteroidales bacterium]|nr:T9SS type A sorting domain-containing protein [Bacteroidales bacterium]
DEERLMFKNLAYGNVSENYNIKDLNTALKRVELAVTFFFTIPGPKMIWQFGELGYDISIDDPCRVCNKPILWEYYDNINRKNLYQVFSALTNLKTSYEVFSTTNFELNVAGKYKRINLYHNTMDVVVLGNFDVARGSLDPSFSRTGMWYEYFSGDSLEVTDVNANIDLLPGAYRIYTTERLTPPDIALDVIKYPDTSLDFSVDAFPNPSSDIFNISIYAKLPVKVDVSIYDMSGRMISRLATQLMVSGTQVIQWNGKSTAGTKIESGLYFVNIQSPRGSKVLKVIRQ